MHIKQKYTYKDRIKLTPDHKRFIFYLSPGNINDLDYIIKRKNFTLKSRAVRYCISQARYLERKREAKENAKNNQGQGEAADTGGL